MSIDDVAFAAEPQPEAPTFDQALFEPMDAVQQTLFNSCGGNVNAISGKAWMNTSRQNKSTMRRYDNDGNASIECLKNIKEWAEGFYVPDTTRPWILHTDHADPYGSNKRYKTAMINNMAAICIWALIGGKMMVTLKEAQTQYLQIQNGATGDQRLSQA